MVDGSKAYAFVFADKVQFLDLPWVRIMDKEEKEKIEKYRKYLKQEAEKFRLTSEDLGNLYDCMWMMDTPNEIHQDFRKTLKLNKMDKWFHDLMNRLERVVVPELKNG